ncbi:tetratricopeptide (TPR) repeat protein [Rhizobium tropici]|nr:tetratricopeptide (TPR) repeat protein [Rhizobium tropici]MBB5591757.1 tetratricopeptide (TPR) repeat protein [Rhizobium tropici]MBB6490811.1 tetratricopeptide (TPR) repeat protein [Rhizobium tropici]
MIKLVSGRGYLFTAEVSTRQEGLDPRPALSDTPIADAPATYPIAPRHWLGLPKALVLSGAALLCMLAMIFGVTVFSSGFGGISGNGRPVIEVLPIVDTVGDAQSAALAQSVAAEMINGLARIDDIRLVLPKEREPVTSGKPPFNRSDGADFLLQGELQRSPQAWILQTRFINASSREVVSVAEVKLDASEPDQQRLASRLAAGAGYDLAVRLNKFGQADSAPQAGAASVAIKQASASINQTTHERFATARSILEKYLTEQPDNVDLQIALAALHLRGIQLAWYNPAESRAAENDARSLLERALKARPNFLPVLGTYCRFLTVTNQFAESLVACARALSLNPWDGTALFHLGLTQVQLGRFEDGLATFEQADRFDTPDVSRWTWLLGAGFADLLLDHNEDAVEWLQRSITITPGTGRAHMLLATAYQRLGRTDEAKQAFATALQLRPGSTASNLALPSLNASPTYLEESTKIIRTLIEMGLPAGDGQTQDGKSQ